MIAMNPSGGRALGVLAALSAVMAYGPTAQADPCGMVPPLWQGQGPALTRVGDQHTFVAFRNGIETMVLRPAFHGKVDTFGMLIPFPSPPAIRKAADDIFSHIQWAAEPQPVTLDLNPFDRVPAPSAVDMSFSDATEGAEIRRDEVRVISEEAVGMYSVAVLEAGSPAALKKWMTQNGFRYPSGMDDVVEDYVRERFAFVAVKTKVGSKERRQPYPGMRGVDDGPTAGFQGAVQAMAFRFRSRVPIIPMRLSTFNPTQAQKPARNIVYFLGEQPMRIDQVAVENVRRQVSGPHLLRNMSQPLPVRVIGGGIADIKPHQWRSIAQARDPKPHLRLAKELFAADAWAFQHDTLALTFEEKEKELLRVSEALMLRGGEIDTLHDEALRREKQKTLGRNLQQVRQMTLTIIDGNFPADVLRRENLTLSAYRMPKQRNTRRWYDPVAKAGVQNADSWLLVRGKELPTTPFWKRW